MPIFYIKYLKWYLNCLCEQYYCYKLWKLCHNWRLLRFHSENNEVKFHPNDDCNKSSGKEQAIRFNVHPASIKLVFYVSFSFANINFRFKLRIFIFYESAVVIDLVFYFSKMIFKLSRILLKKENRKEDTKTG